MYLKQDRDRKRIQQGALKKTTKYEDYKAKDRMRKRKQKKSVTATSTSAVSSPSHSSPLTISSSFSSKQALGKATARATRALPKSPQKKAQILQKLRYTALLGRKFHYNLGVLSFQQNSKKG